MSSLKDYEIKFSGLKLGEHEFDYKLNNEFFDLFGYSDFEDSNIQARVVLEKKSNSLELDFKIEGVVRVPCDLTTELFDMPLANELHILVKFGDAYDSSGEDILVLPFGEHYLNIAQYLYEAAVLAVPLKKIHPDVKSGKKGKEMLERLKKLSPEEKEDQEIKNKETDPRWDKLKSLLN